MSLIRWVGDEPEPCDRCRRPLSRDGNWIAWRNPYAPQGVAFNCRDCYVELVTSATVDKWRELGVFQCDQ